MKKAELENKKIMYHLDEDCGGMTIHKMFWIAASVESEDLKEVLEEMQIKDLTRIFPKATIPQLEGVAHTDTPGQIFIENDMFGFFAETRFPNHYDFRYNNGEVIGCSVSRGSQQIDYVYGETIPELLKEMERIAAINLEYCKQMDHERKKPKKSKAANLR